MGAMRFKDPAIPKWIMASDGFSDCVFMVIVASDGQTPLVAAHVTPQDMKNDPEMIKKALVASGNKEELTSLKSYLICKDLGVHKSTYQALETLKIPWTYFDVNEHISKKAKTWGVAFGAISGSLKIVILNEGFVEVKKHPQDIYTKDHGGQSGKSIFLCALDGTKIG